jgi:hypothetical protein
VHWYRNYRYSWHWYRTNFISCSTYFSFSKSLSHLLADGFFWFAFKSFSQADLLLLVGWHISSILYIFVSISGCSRHYEFKASTLEWKNTGNGLQTPHNRILQDGHNQCCGSEIFSLLFGKFFFFRILSPRPIFETKISIRVPPIAFIGTGMYSETSTIRQNKLFQ